MILWQTENHWLVFAQPDHARLAARLLELWGNENVPAPPNRDRLVQALVHHDDGWIPWEQSPTIEPASGRPRSFTEMVLSVSLDLWRVSIEICAKLDPLMGLWVSRHFAALAESSLERRTHAEEEIASLKQFLREQEEPCAEWLRRAESMSEPGGRGEIEHNVTEGFLGLRFFDSLSLWLCGHPNANPTPWTAKTPGGPKVRFELNGHSKVTAVPYPFAAATVTLKIPARKLAVRRFRTDLALREAIDEAPRMDVVWKICRKKFSQNRE